MARKPKNANIDIRQTARVFDEQAFVDGVFNDDYILVVGSGVILDRKQFPDSKGDINQYIIDEINNDRREVQSDFIDHKSFTILQEYRQQTRWNITTYLSATVGMADLKRQSI